MKFKKSLLNTLIITEIGLGLNLKIMLEKWRFGNRDRNRLGNGLGNWIQGCWEIGRVIGWVVSWEISWEILGDNVTKVISPVGEYVGKKNITEMVGQYVGDYCQLGDKLGNSHWLARGNKSGFLHKKLGNTLWRGLYPTYSPDFPPPV
jgi:hypothetical protein